LQASQPLYSLARLLATFLIFSDDCPHPFTPILTLPPSSAPPRQPLRSSASSQGLATRVLRAERAYQKMLLGRDALIAKVGPAPHDVSLFPQTRNRGHPTPFGTLFPTRFFCPHELERVGELSDGGEWVCGISQLQEQDCIVYSVGTLGSLSLLAFETR